MMMGYRRPSARNFANQAEPLASSAAREIKVHDSPCVFVPLFLPQPRLGVHGDVDGKAERVENRDDAFPVMRVVLHEQHARPVRRRLGTGSLCDTPLSACDPSNHSTTPSVDSDVDDPSVR